MNPNDRQIVLCKRVPAREERWMDVDFTGEISSKCHSMDAPERAACVRTMDGAMHDGWLRPRSGSMKKKPFNKSERVTE